MMPNFICIPLKFNLRGFSGKCMAFTSVVINFYVSSKKTNRFLSNDKHFLPQSTNLFLAVHILLTS